MREKIVLGNAERLDELIHFGKVARYIAAYTLRRKSIAEPFF